MLVSGFESYEAALGYMRQISKTNLSSTSAPGTGRSTPSSTTSASTVAARRRRHDLRSVDEAGRAPYILVVPRWPGTARTWRPREGLPQAHDRGRGRRLHRGVPLEVAGAWKFFTDHYRDTCRPTSSWEGSARRCPHADGDRRPLLHRRARGMGLKFLRASPLKMGLTYYSHIIDQGRAVFLRMTRSFHPSPAPTRSRSEGRAPALPRGGPEALPCDPRPVRFRPSRRRGRGEDGRLRRILNSIKRTLDPMNILNPR